MVNIRPLDPVLQKKATEELNEDPVRIQKDLEALREWIKKSPHIKSRDDDQFLVNFLRGCKYSMEKAKQKFDLYHTLKTHIPELTKNRDPLNEKVLGAIRQGVGLPLPNLENPDGPRYFLVRPGCYNPSEYSIQDIMKVSSMIADLTMIDDDNVVVAGQIGILDFSGVSMSHFLQFNPTFIKKMTMLQQDATPLRQKASHFVNMPAIALSVFNIFQSFTNEKNKKRVRFSVGKALDKNMYSFFYIHFRFSFMELTWKLYTRLCLESFCQRNMVERLEQFKRSLML